MVDPNCQKFNSDRSECMQCKSIYQLFQGTCLQYPTGLIVAPNGGTSCQSGYSLQNNSCFKSSNTLTKISSGSLNIIFTYSSNGLNNFPFIGSNFFWTPRTSQLN